MSGNTSNLYGFLFPVRYPLYVTYAIFGPLAVISNLFVLIVVLSDKKVREKSALIVGLAVGNLCSGLHAFGYGVYRLPLFLAGSLEQPASIRWCMVSMMPTSFLLGFSMPATLQFASGLERMVAISAFKWYRINWSPRKNWYMVGAAYVVSICVWVVPTWYRAFSDQSIKATRECSSTATISASLLKYMVIFVITIGTAAVVCLLTAVVVGYRNYKRLNHSSGVTTAESSLYKSQLRVSRMMLAVAICELCLVVLPNLLLITGRLFPTSISPIVSAYAIDIYCVNSFINIFIYHGMNNAFRKAATQKFRLLLHLCECQCGSNNTIHPSNTHF